MTKEAAEGAGWHWRDFDWVEVTDPHTAITQTELVVMVTMKSDSFRITFVQNPDTQLIDVTKTKIELVRRFNTLSDVVGYINSN